MAKRKSEKRKRKKRLIKQIVSLKKQADRHQGLIETEGGKLDTTSDYWRDEKAEYERQANEIRKILKKLKKKK